MDKNEFKKQIQYKKESEAEKIIEEVSKKFGYSQELSNLLSKIYHKVYSETSYEMQQNFFQTLQEVPIVIVDKMTPELYEQLQDKYLGKDRIQTKSEESEYNSTFAPGAYVTTPVLDSQGNLIGKRSFLYVERLNSYFEEVTKKLETNIHVPHLLHELGHAQAARKNEYIQEGNKIKSRCGMLQTEDEVEFEDGKPILIEKESQGIYLEEAINTVLEYENIAKFLGIKPEEVDNALYRGVGIHGLVSSSYHGIMDSIGQKMQEVIGKKGLEQIRIFDNQTEIEEFNKKAKNTQYWKENVHSEERIKRKIEIFEMPESGTWKDFCHKNQDNYFGIHKEETPIQKIDNVLRQIYDMKTAKYSISIEEYKEVLNSILGEAYYILNQTELEYQKNNSKISLDNLK